MAMTDCRECGKDISTTAKSCPQCGAKVPRFKWWLWVPIGLVVVFFGYAFSIPEYKAQASRLREVCEQMIGGRGMARQYECDRIYTEAIERGRAAAR